MVKDVHEFWIQRRKKNFQDTIMSPKQEKQQVLFRSSIVCNEDIGKYLITL